MTIPDGTGGEILLPINRQDIQVMLDGPLVWDGGPTGQCPIEMAADELLLTEVDGGTRQVTAASSCYHAFLPLVARLAALEHDLKPWRVVLSRSFGDPPPRVL
jgi:hypothetical protein